MFKKKHSLEFEKHAKLYDKFSKVQKKVVAELVENIKSKPKKILDIGCGSGAVYKNISWDIDKFVGVDNSSSMCSLHPKNSKTEIVCEDFDAIKFDELGKVFGKFDMIISSSSLQWSKDIENIFRQCKKNSKDIAFAIFTDKTFQDIYKITKKKNFLPKAEDINRYTKENWDVKIWKKEYKLYFEDNLSKFRYIKKSGTSGGVEQLTYRQMRELIRRYPSDYLEFEVIFIISENNNS